MGEQKKPEPEKKVEPKPEVKVVPYWLVVITDSIDKPPACIKCEDKEAFEAALNENVLSAKEDLHAFAFRGDRIQIGTPQPVGVYVIDGKTVQVGKTNVATDTSGRIVPLVPRSDN